MLGAQILSADGNAILVPTTEGGSVPLRKGMIFDPFHRQPGRHGPLGIFQRRAAQRHSLRRA